MGVSELVDLTYANAQLHVDFTLDDEDRIYLRQHIRFTVPYLGSLFSTRWRLVLSQQLGAFAPEPGRHVWDFIPLLIPDFLQPGAHHILRIAKFFVASESNRVNPSSSLISNVTQRQRLPAGGRGLFPHTLYEFNEHELVQRVCAVCCVLCAVCCVLCAVCCALCAVRVCVCESKAHCERRRRMTKLKTKQLIHRPSWPSHRRRVTSSETVRERLACSARQHYVKFSLLG